MAGKGCAGYIPQVAWSTVRRHFAGRRAIWMRLSRSGTEGQTE